MYFGISGSLLLNISAGAWSGPTAFLLPNVLMHIATSCLGPRWDNQRMTFAAKFPSPHTREGVGADREVAEKVVERMYGADKG